MPTTPSNKINKLQLKPQSFSTKRSILFLSCISLYLSLLFNEHLFLLRNVPHVATDSIHNSIGKPTPEPNHLPPTAIHSAHHVNSHCLPLPPPSSPAPPRIYLHIGPHKTGTTSLQDYLACNTDFLSRHNAHYLGKINPNDVKPCRSVPPDLLRPLLQNPSPHAVRQLRAAIAFHVSRNRSVILSSEDMMEIPPAALSEALSLDGPVTIVPVVGYRRCYEWLLSLYHFRYEPHWYDLDRWRDWDDVVDDDIPTLRSFVNRWIEERRLPPPLTSLYNVSTFLSPLPVACPQILNLHSQNDISVSFLKLITGDAPPSSFPPPWHANVRTPKSYAVDAEILALKLHREKRLAPVLPRRVVVHLLQTKMTSMYSKNVTPPLDCLTAEEEEALLRASREAERVVVPEFFFRGGGREAMEEEFRRMAREEQAFCSVDLEEMRKESGWETMWTKLKLGRLLEQDFVVPEVEPSDVSSQK